MARPRRVLGKQPRQRRVQSKSATAAGDRRVLPLSGIGVEEHRARLDPVTRMVAAAVQHAAVTGPDRPELTGKPAGVVTVTGTASTALATEIHVETENGPRLFVVVVRETSPG